MERREGPTLTTHAAVRQARHGTCNHSQRWHPRHEWATRHRTSLHRCRAEPLAAPAGVQSSRRPLPPAGSTWGSTDGRRCDVARHTHTVARTHSVHTPSSRLPEQC